MCTDNGMCDMWHGSSRSLNMQDAQMERVPKLVWTITEYVNEGRKNDQELRKIKAIYRDLKGKIPDDNYISLGRVVGVATGEEKNNNRI